MLVWATFAWDRSLQNCDLSWGGPIRTYTRGIKWPLLRLVLFNLYPLHGLFLNISVTFLVLNVGLPDWASRTTECLLNLNFK